MKDASEPRADRETGLPGKPIWLGLLLAPVIAVAAWWYFGVTAVEAYHLATEGVVVSGQVVEKRGGKLVEYIDVRSASVLPVRGWW